MEDAAFYAIVAFLVLTVTAGAVFFFGMKQSTDELLYAKGNIFFPSDDAPKEKKKKDKAKKKKRKASLTLVEPQGAEAAKVNVEKPSPPKIKPQEKNVNQEKPLKEKSTAKVAVREVKKPVKVVENVQEVKEVPESVQKASPAATKKAKKPKKKAIVVPETAVAKVSESEAEEVETSKAAEDVPATVVDTSESLLEPITASSNETPISSTTNSPASLKPRKKKKKTEKKFFSVLNKENQTEPGTELSLDFKEALRNFEHAKFSEKELMTLGEILMRKEEHAAAEWVSIDRQSKRRSSGESKSSFVDSKTGKKILLAVEEELATQKLTNQENFQIINEKNKMIKNLQQELQRAKRSYEAEIKTVSSRYENEIKRQKDEFEDLETQLKKDCDAVNKSNQQMKLKVVAAETNLSKAMENDESTSLKVENSKLQDELKKTADELNTANSRVIELTNSIKSDNSQEILQSVQSQLKSNQEKLDAEKARRLELEESLDEAQRTIKDKNDHLKETMLLTEEKLKELEQEVAIREAESRETIARLSNEIELTNSEMLKCKEEFGDMQSKVNSSHGLIENIEKLEDNLEKKVAEVDRLMEERSNLVADIKKKDVLLQSYASEAASFTKKCRDASVSPDLQDNGDVETGDGENTSHLLEFKKCLALAYAKLEEFGVHNVNDGTIGTPNGVA